MLWSNICQLPLGLLLTCLSSSSASAIMSRGPIVKRDPEYNVLGGVNFPDPSIWEVDGVSYVFGTVDGNGHNVPMTSNSDFTDASGWSAITDAFPQEDVPAVGSGGWAVANTAWAPDVNQLTDGDGSFVMYYAPQLASNAGIHCLGVARSEVITGPYNDSSTEPWICPESAGGAIDAAGFLDSDNSRYVVYKIDGPSITNGGYCNSPNNPPSTNTSLMLQQLESDGYTFIGTPVVLYNNQGVSDSYNVEAPSLKLGPDGTTYFLFFSSGCTSANSYTVSYVTSTTGVGGPYGNRQVLLETGDYGLYGPGGADISLSDGNMVFASLSVSGDISYPRVLSTAVVSLSGQTVTVN